MRGRTKGLGGVGWPGSAEWETLTRGRAKDKWEAMEKVSVVLRMNWLMSVDRDQDYDRG